MTTWLLRTAQDLHARLHALGWRREDRQLGRVEFYSQDEIIDRVIVTIPEVPDMALCEIRGRALKRDPTVPIGQPSPMHVDCLCGLPVPIADDLNACAACGAVYNARGYVMAR